LYQALLARDSRFDGRFFVGVTSTGIYCRPICRVRMPLQRNCRFFEHPAGAELAGFRPCLRCRPELAPGLSRAESSSTLAHQAARLLDAAVSHGQELSMARLAQRLGVTDRHLRRIFVAALGVPPLAYLNTRRLLQAKQMLTDTRLPVTEVAHAAGFGSVRRFNAAFAGQYRLNPSRLRQQTAPHIAPSIRSQTATPINPTWVHVNLGYRPPFDVAALRSFLASRAVPGLETVEGSGAALRYCRSLAVMQLDQLRIGWVCIEADGTRPVMRVDLSDGLLPAIGQVLERVRQAMDLDADPSLIDPAVARLGYPPRPGLRLPGAIDGFESAVRVVLGQQVSVAAARTLTSRLVAALGEPLNIALIAAEPGIERLFPTPLAVAKAEPATIGKLGIVRQRVAALQALAQAVSDGRLQLDRAAPMEATLAALRLLPGIGEWTVQLIAMRALGWPDAFPATDLALLKALGTRDPADAQRRVEVTRPWRAYAVMRCWQTLEPDDADLCEPEQT
jgi:AraC family transcriptional regulator, regulatory protein of adaptative response / DNA-3-methyladenine glycosylase II